MKAAVTGVNGFVGSHLGELLHKEGDEVVGICRKSSNRDNLAGIDIELRHADVSSADALADAFKGVEVVYHVAGVTKARSKEQLHNVNAQGSARVMEAARRAGVRRVVLVSSQEAVGPASIHDPAGETQKPSPVSDYGHSKRAGAVEAWAHSEALELVIVRPPTVYGPRDTDMLDNMRVAKRGLAPTFGLGRRFIVSLIHAEDLARALRLAGDHHDRIHHDDDPHAPSGQGIFHVDDGSPVAWDELSMLQAELQGRKAIKVAVPSWINYVAATGSEMMGRVRGRVPIVNRDKWRAAKQVGWVFDTSRAQELLGWEPLIDLRTGTEQTIAWYRERGKL